MLNGLAQDVIHVAVAQDVGRMVIVGTEAAAAAVFGRDGRQQVQQIACARRFPYQQVHAKPQSLQRLLDRGALVVRPDAGSNIGVQPGAAGAWTVPVHDPSCEGGHFGKNVRVAQDQPWVIHHLGQAENPRVIEQRDQLLCIQGRAGCAHMRRRHA